MTLATSIDELALLRQIEENPGDGVRKKVYADWLDDHGAEAAAKFWRTGELTGGEFHTSVIAQDDDGDYSESGYVACLIERDGRKIGLLGDYSHCSCFDTWASLNGGGVNDYYGADEITVPEWVWAGSIDGLVTLARRKGDPALPSRTADEKDNDFDHLMKVYDQITARLYQEAA